MRVVHVITRGDVGGAQTHVVELAAAQAQSGDVVSVVAGCDGPAMTRARELGIEVDIVPTLAAARAAGSLRGAYRDIARRIDGSGCEVVHSHSSHAGLLTRLAARRLGIASVYTAHGWPFQRGAPWRQRVSSFTGEAVGARLGDMVICLTEAEAQRALRARVVSASRLAIVPNGISDVAPAFRRDPLRRAADDTIRMVMVARFAPPKLQRELVESLVAVADLPWELSFIGDGPARAACESRSRRLLGERVRYLGHRDDVAEVLAASDVGLLWSRYEGMPIALMESMRAGLCCIASDLPGVRALFGTPPAGLVAGSDDSLTASLRNLLGDRSRIDHLGALARRRYEEAFTADAMVTATRAVYEAAIRRHHGGHRGPRT